MSSKTEKDKTKQLQDKCQSVLNSLLRDEDNKYCVDCDSKGPRWASWNLGVFLCIRCAGIHRNLGVHISKVKSVNLDSWTPEQVVSLQQMGNSRARAVYEANLPDNFRRPQNDSSLESFIRAKYEHKKYIAKEWIPPTLPKVNWEKEIDEEIEKQKRKKKTVVEKKIVNSVEVPQLPKPKNPSPKPSRSQQVIINTENKNNDLLALQNGDDSFQGFVSAPPKEDQKSEENDASKSEEESFFNQTTPVEKEKVKLTKDSILALYANTQITNFNTVYQNPLGQVPYQQNYTGQTGYQSYGGTYPQQNFSVANGLGGYAPPGVVQMSGQQFPNQQWVPSPQTNVHYLQGQTQPGANQFSIGQFQTPQYAASPQFQNPQYGQSQQTTGFAQLPNPFSSVQAGGALQQQFGNLSLSNPTTANPSPTLATNLWQ